MMASLAGAVEGVSLVTAPLLGGLITESISWRWFSAQPVSGL